MSRLVSVAVVLMMVATANIHAATKNFVELGPSFSAQKKQIEIELAEGKIYSEISKDEVANVRAALDRISDALNQSGSIEALNDASKLQIFNDQRVVNDVLTKAKNESRLICVRERTLGSQRPTSQCHTVAQRKRQTENAQRTMENSQRSVRQGKAL